MFLVFLIFYICKIIFYFSQNPPPYFCSRNMVLFLIISLELDNYLFNLANFKKENEKKSEKLKNIEDSFSSDPSVDVKKTVKKSQEQMFGKQKKIDKGKSRVFLCFLFVVFFRKSFPFRVSVLSCFSACSSSW